MTVGETVELECPGFGGIAQTGDQQDVGTLASLFDPQGDVADVNLGRCAPSSSSRE